MEGHIQLKSLLPTSWYLPCKLREEVGSRCLAMHQGLGVLAHTPHSDLCRSAYLEARPLRLTISGTTTSFGQPDSGNAGG